MKKFLVRFGIVGVSALIGASGAAVIAAANPVPPTAPVKTAGSLTFSVGISGSVTFSSSASSTLTVTGKLPSALTWTSVSGGKAVIKGTPTITSGGSYPITVTATNISGSASQGFTLLVDQAPSLATATKKTFTVGKAGTTFQFDAKGFPTPIISEVGSLPAGVTLSQAGLLSGTPAVLSGGSYQIVVKASNTVAPVASMPFTVTVDESPVITSAASTTFVAGVTKNFQVTGAGYPAPTFSLVAVSGPSPPPGLKFTGTSGVLSGYATTAGVYHYTVVATNGTHAANATQAFTVNVLQRPAVPILSSGSLTFTTGVTGSATFSAPGVPTPTFTLKLTLPKGLTFAGSSITGSPAPGTGGAYPISITGTNSVGSATATFTLTVDQAPAISSVATLTVLSSQPVSFVAVATGFPSPSFSVTGGTLPPGLSLSASGLLSGTAPQFKATGGAIVLPTQWVFSLSASNSVSSVTQSFSIVVNPPSASKSPQGGYSLAAADGGILNYGGAAYFGSVSGKPLSAPIVAMATSPGDLGYWLVASDGGVFAFGNAGYYGSMGGKPLDSPISGMNATPTGGGYWLVASDGGIFSFGNAGYYGSMGGKHLVKTIVAMATTPNGRGYWLVAADGGIFAFGNAGYFGSMGGKTLNKPIVGMAVAPTGGGYWMVATDGGMFSFGNAGYFGSTGGRTLNQPIVAMKPTPTGLGYWLVAADGGIFNFGKAVFSGSGGSLKLVQPIVAIS